MDQFIEILSLAVASPYGVVGAVILIVFVVAVVLGRIGRTRNQIARLSEAVERLSRDQVSVAGQLAQLGDLTASGQARVAERLQSQERDLTHGVERRLSALADQVERSLSRSAGATNSTLGDVRARLAAIDAARDTISTLSTQVTGLQEVLSNKQARGAFGQVQMNDIVSSLLPPSAYDFEVTLGNGRRVDCLLRLPEPPGAIGLDSKFPLEAYAALVSAKTEREAKRAGQAFAADLTKHLQDIADRYIVPGETADAALMFVPSEAVFAEIHTRFADIVAKSFELRVWIVSPTTLMATVNTMRAILKDAAVLEQAHVIRRELALLVGDVERLDERVTRLQRHHAQAEEDLRQIRISTEKIVRRGGRIDMAGFDDRRESEIKLIRRSDGEDTEPGVRQAG